MDKLIELMQRVKIELQEVYTNYKALLGHYQSSTEEKNRLQDRLFQANQETKRLERELAKRTAVTIREALDAPPNEVSAELQRAANCERTLQAKCEQLERENMYLRGHLSSISLAAKSAALDGLFANEKEESPRA